MTVEQARDAGELLQHALRRTRPTDKTGDYRRLLDLYASDLNFRAVVDAFGEGLGLTILTTTRAGLVLTPTPDSVFATKMADMRLTLSAEDKLIAGLALLGIAAYAYPNEIDLDDPDARSVDIASVDKFIRDAAKKLTADPAVAAADKVSSAAEVYLDKPDYDPTEQGRYKRGCTYKALDEVLGWLESQGMARPQPTLGAGVFQLTDRFRVLVADEATNAAYQQLAGLSRSYDRKVA